MRNEVRSYISAFLIAFLISFGGICCMITAFAFDAYKMSTLVLFCLIFSAVTALIAGVKRSILVVLGVAVLAIGVFFRRQAVNSLRFLLQCLTERYDQAYGFGVFGEGSYYLEFYGLNWAFCIFAGLVITAVVWTLRKRFTAVFAVAAGILPLASCLVVTDTVPAKWAIFLLLTGLVLLILTHSVRRRDEWDGNRLTAMLLVPVCLMNLLLFWAIPQDSYRADQTEMQEKLNSWFWSLPFMPEVEGSGGKPAVLPVVQGLDVKLDQIGHNSPSDLAVMYVEAEKDGILYLRGQAYDVYSGDRWQVRKNLAGATLGWPSQHLQTVQTLQIRTTRTRDLRFFPYYMSRADWLEDYKEGRLSNKGMIQLRSYIYSQAAAAPWASLTEENQLTDALNDHYTALPEQTAEAARAILAGVDLRVEHTLEEKAEVIADFVRQSATYDLMTDKMPEDQQDFAIWFLENGTTGYCVHFATAATVLLRAAEIPCRYVTGYVVYTVSGRQVPVSDQLSHAWVEYYDPQIGWRILEATPSDAMPQAPELSDPTETTAPTETTERPEMTRPEDKPTQNRPTGEETTKDSTTGGNGSGGVQQEKPDRTGLWKCLKALAWIAGIGGALWLQFWGRKRWRLVRMHDGPTNKRCLARWREVLRFCRILKTEPPEELRTLAEKARFSQHKIVAEELRCFDSWLRQAEKQVKAKKFALLYRLFWAV